MHCQMFGDTRIEFFDKIARAYPLPSNHYYQYLQLRNYLNEKVQLKIFEDRHPLMGYMAKKCQDGNTKSLTGQMYHILQGNEDLNSIKEKWEQEFKITM